MNTNKFKQTEIGGISKIWQESRVGDHIELAYGDGLPERARKNGSVPVFGSNGVTGFHDKALVKGPGIIIGRKGTVGQVVFSKTDFWPIDTTYYVKIKGDDDIVFWYYFLSTLGLKQMNSHSAVPGLNRDNVYEIAALLPSLPEQRAIAKILSDIDDKIELNQQMNKTLESIAQAIFKRWFVDFEFPGHEKTKFVNGLPEGWRMSKIGEELITVLGGTPAREKSQYWDNGTIPWINSSKANEFRVIEPSEFITQEGLNNSATKLMPEKTTIIAITGATLGRISLLEISACANQSIVGVLSSDKLPAEFVYFWMKNNIDTLVSWQTGGAQQHINKNNVNDLALLCPSNQVIQKYSSISKPLFERIKLNCFESRTLNLIRDSLLPRLMSGKIRIN